MPMMEFVTVGIWRLLEVSGAAPLPALVAGYTAGFLLVSYGAYYAWFFGGTHRVKNNISLKGKTVIITGANAGIGRETAVDLATRGARVIMACRNPAKAQAALSEVRRRSGNDNIVFRRVDLSDLISVRTFADHILREEERLDILINNAGVGRPRLQLSPEGFDIVMATNHVGHFVLTLSLLDLLKNSAPSRVLNVSSISHHNARDVDYTNRAAKGMHAGLIAGADLYARSKLANILFTKELARRLAGTGVTTYSLHPGFIHTNIWETACASFAKNFLYYFMFPILKLFALNEKDGAQTTIYCATEEYITASSGSYFSNCRLAEESELGKDAILAKQLWDVSCEATGFDPDTMLAKT